MQKIKHAWEFVLREGVKERRVTCFQKRMFKERRFHDFQSWKSPTSHTQNWFPEFFKWKFSLASFFSLYLACFFVLFFSLWLYMSDVCFFSSFLFPVYDTVQESWTRPHTGHSDLPERRRACEWTNRHKRTHWSSDSFFFYVQENTHMQIWICIHRQTHSFTLFSPTVLLLSLCCSHSVKANIL